MEPAPLYHDIAGGPEGGHAVWLTAPDGVRLRLAVWPGGARGTVLLFQGRTEYAEKYGEAAARFAARGLSTLAIDWRGQGLSDRLLPEPTLGHVHRFEDYQRDVAALVAALPGLGVEAPFFLLAHSMGGAIGLRAVMEGLPVRGAVFSAPMWDINMTPIKRAAARAVGHAAAFLGQAHRFAPGTSARANYVQAAPFEGNELTGDAGIFARLQDHLDRQPDLTLGGPSVHWVMEALSECADLARRPAPDLRALTFLGSEESIVSPAAIRARMARWPCGELVQLPGAHHEALMETPPIRDAVYDRMAAFFDARLAAAPQGQTVPA